MKKCLVCGTDIREEKPLKSGKYNIYKCYYCGIVFSLPLPTHEELINYYQGFVFEKPNEKEISKLIKKSQLQIKRLFNLSTNNKNKLFLDYGGGVGINWKGAKDSGLISYYFDIDNQAKNFAKANLGLSDENILSGNDNSLTFDYILCDNVIEHIPDPAKLIESLYSKLNHGGKLIVKTPAASNTETFLVPRVLYIYLKKSLQQNSIGTALTYTFKHKYHHCDPPRHIYSFSKKSLKILSEIIINEKSHIKFNYYSIPFFKYAFFNQFKKAHNSFFKILIFIVLFPFILMESILEFCRIILVKVRVLKPSGLIAVIEKNH